MREQRCHDGEAKCSAKATMPIRKSLRRTELRKCGVEDERDVIRAIGRWGRICHDNEG